MKMWVVFSKCGPLKHIGHLDLMRAMQRALRRSGLPVRYSQGFNPHILLSLAAPLSVGHEGLREVMEVPLHSEISAEAFSARLNGALPPLIRVHRARQVEDSQPAPMALLAAAVYRIQPMHNLRQLGDSLQGFLAQGEIIAQRRSKRGMVDVDLRPLIHSLTAQGEGFEAVLALRQAGTCKPRLLMERWADFAQVDAPDCDIARVQLLAEGLTPLEDA